MRTANGLSIVQLATTAQGVFDAVLERERPTFTGEMWQEVASKSIGILDGSGDDGPMELDAVALAEQLHETSRRWQHPPEEFEKLDAREQTAWEAVARTMAGLMQLTPDEFPRVGQSIEVATQWAARRVPQEV